MLHSPPSHNPHSIINHKCHRPTRYPAPKIAIHKFQAGICRLDPRFLLLLALISNGLPPPLSFPPLAVFVFAGCVELVFDDSFVVELSRVVVVEISEFVNEALIEVEISVGLVSLVELLPMLELESVVDVSVLEVFVVEESVVEVSVLELKSVLDVSVLDVAVLDVSVLDVSILEDGTITPGLVVGIVTLSWLVVLDVGCCCTVVVVVVVDAGQSADTTCPPRTKANSDFSGAGTPLHCFVTSAATLLSALWQPSEQPDLKSSSSQVGMVIP